MVYDLVVLGGGPAGYLAAERAAQAGLNVLLIEKRELGGVCLNEGCIPSKALLYSAKLLEQARHGQAFGVQASEASLNHSVVIARKDRVVKSLVAGVRAKLKKCGVTLVQGVGSIEGREGKLYKISVKEEESRIPVKAEDHKISSYHCTNLLLATGSVPVLPPIEGLSAAIDRGYALTNREILSLGEVPKTLAVIGGGVVGLEMASYYAAAGSKVSVVEMLDRIGGPLDKQLSEALLIKLKKKGILFILSSKVSSVGLGGVKAIEYEKDGQKQVLVGEKVLVSIGRKPFIKGYGLETIGVETASGRIPTDEFGRTNRPNVYAAGDVNGVSMLAHTAYREAEVAVSHMLGKKDRMRYDAIPSVIYTQPEVACVGESSESAMAKGLETVEAVLPMAYSGRYQAENERGEGFVKIIAEKSTRRLLGVHLIGSYASEIIYGAALMLEMELRVEDVKKLVFPHPTVAEVIREALFEI